MQPPQAQPSPVQGDVLSKADLHSWPPQWPLLLLQLSKTFLMILTELHVIIWASALLPSTAGVLCWKPLGVHSPHNHRVPLWELHTPSSATQLNPTRLLWYMCAFCIKETFVPEVHNYFNSPEPVHNQPEEQAVLRRVPAEAQFPHRSLWRGNLWIF